MKTNSHAQLLALIAICFFVTSLCAAPLGSAFNYNGRLLDGTSPANGDHDFEFNLFDENRFGFPIAPAFSAPNVLVSNGLFSTTIDLGASAFDGSGKWLEISVRRSGSGAEFVILTPRQAINPVPYALFSARAATASNVAPGAVTTASIHDGAITPEKLASGGLVTSLNGLRNDVTLAAGSGVTITPTGNTLTLASTGDDWKLGGNAGTLPDSQFLGTTDSQPLTFKVNNNRVLRLEIDRNIIAGSEANSIAPGVFGAVISGGGGAPAEPNQILAGSTWATISGGARNKIEPDAGRSTVGGGHGNVIGTNAFASTINGGQFNHILPDSLYGSIGGGYNNLIYQNSTYGTIAGGRNNTILTSLDYGTIGGGNQNFLHDGSDYTTIAGGNQNRIEANAAVSTIGGGDGNTIHFAASRATIAGGWNNSISNLSRQSFIGGGANNEVMANTIYGTIGGGEGNLIHPNATHSTIGGGNLNSISNAPNSSIPGGLKNFVSGSGGVVGGGVQNTNRGRSATIPGGELNAATANFTFAAGRRAKANHAGSYVWADSADSDFASTAPDQYLIRAAGGIGINTNNPTSALHVHGTISASTFAGNGSALIGIVPGAGSVGPAQLAKPYQSGAISLQSFPTLGNFQSYRATHTVTFPTAFSLPPIVTLALETSLSSAAERIQPILVKGKRTTGFDLAFPVLTLPVPVVAMTSIGRAPMMMVNGHPAIVHVDGISAKFARSADTTGLRWPPGTTMITSVNANSQLKLSMVVDHPAVAFLDFSGNLKFTRASDTNGAAWAAPVMVQAAVPGTFAPQQISLAIINGNPAIACWDYSGNQIWYFRANDAKGATWPLAGILVTNGHSGISLAQINNRPAISFVWDNESPSVTYEEDVRYIRALDEDGAAWPDTSVTVVDGDYTHRFFADTYLLTVAGNPAIAFAYDTSTSFFITVQPRFARASDSDGTAWAASVEAGRTESRDGICASLVGGQPALVWYDYTTDVVYYSNSADDGASFGATYAYRNSGPSTPTLLDVDGRPAITFSSPEELRYIRDTNPIPDTFINWIAVLP